MKAKKKMPEHGTKEDKGQTKNEENTKTNETFATHGTYKGKKVEKKRTKERREVREAKKRSLFIFERARCVVSWWGPWLGELCFVWLIYKCRKEEKKRSSTCSAENVDLPTCKSENERK
jgi:hypothetical protein